MKIAILGHGVEGKSVERYFRSRLDETTRKPHQITIFPHLEASQLKTFKTEDYDLVFRSPSIRPYDTRWTSITKYFFAHCPAKIIGVTGTKGKGTTCSLATTILRSLGHTVHLVGNIGLPALDVLNKITSQDIVVYELSSFQLWDLDRSPNVAVILRLEPDHLDVHTDYAEYLAAKRNISAHQTTTDTCIYFEQSEDSKRLASASAGQLLSYPPQHLPELESLLDQLTVPGQHNRENAAAALSAVAAMLKLSLSELITRYPAQISTVLHDFIGLPHHIEFVRSLNRVDYYDDNYSTAYPSLDAALKAFPDRPLVLIAGGKDKGVNLTDIKRAIFSSKQLVKAILIGEIASQLAAGENPTKFELAASLSAAVSSARTLAEKAATSSQFSPIVLMSPAAASLDMFKSYSDRGDQFQALVKNLR